MKKRNKILLLSLFVIVLIELIFTMFQPPPKDHLRRIVLISKLQIYISENKENRIYDLTTLPFLKGISGTLKRVPKPSWRKPRIIFNPNYYENKEWILITIIHADGLQKKYYKILWNTGETTKESDIGKYIENKKDLQYYNFFD